MTHNLLAVKITKQNAHLKANVSTTFSVGKNKHLIFRVYSTNPTLTFKTKRNLSKK